MYNRIILVGHLGREPEMRYTDKGTAICDFSMATSEKWTGQDGQQQERTVWWRVAAWGKLGEVCNEYLNKGRLVLVEGTMIPDPETGNPRMWEGSDGQMHASFEVRASAVKFLGKGNGRSDDNSEEESPAPKTRSNGNGAHKGAARKAEPKSEEEIPF